MRYCRRFLAGIPHPEVGTHVLLTRPPLPLSLRREDVRLACVRHAASVYPEPGSNSPSKMYIESLTQRLKCIVNELSPLTGSHCTLFIPYHSSVVQVLSVLPHLFAPLQLPAGASGILPLCLRAVKYFYCAFRNFILFRFTNTFPFPSTQTTPWDILRSTSRSTSFSQHVFRRSFVYECSKNPAHD